MKRFLLAAATVVAVFSAVPGGALAGGPGSWTPISTPTSTNLQDPALVREASGTLDVAYKVSGASVDSMRFARVSAAGTLLSGWTLDNPGAWVTLTNPGLTWDPVTNQVRIFYGAQSGIGGSYGGHLYNTWAVGPTSGSTWTWDTTALTANPPSEAYTASNIAATLRADGTPIQAWDQAGDVYVHAGLSPSPTQVLLEGDSSAHYPGLSTDSSTGAVWAAWASIASTQSGVQVARVDPGTGTPLGRSTLAGSWTTYGGSRSFDIVMQRTPIVSRGDSSWVAYPTGYPTTSVVRVWKLDSSFGSATPKTSVIAGSSGGKKALAAIAAETNAARKLWVLWTEESGSTWYVKGRRSNADGTVWGATVSAKAPAGVDQVWKLAACGNDSKVDAVALWQVPSGNVLYQTQLLPGLSVTTSPSKVALKKKATVKVRVLDAGDPVAGASVKIGSATGVTNSAGYASLKIGPFKKATTLSAKATLAGYVAGSVTIRAK